MNRILNVIVLVAVAAAAAASQSYFLDPHFAAEEPMGTSWEGEVISVDPATSAPGQRHALVRLSTGDTIRAVVPGGCFVSLGQTTRVSRLGEGSDKSYVVVENGRS